VPRKFRSASPEEVLAAIVELADDGFCRRGALVIRFRGLGERELRRSIRRAVGLGLALERRGPDGGSYLAVSSEGWALLNSEQGG
jgi:hypothetical protein